MKTLLTRCLVFVAVLGMLSLPAVAHGDYDQYRGFGYGGGYYRHQQYRGSDCGYGRRGGWGSYHRGGFGGVRVNFVAPIAFTGGYCAPFPVARVVALESPVERVIYRDDLVASVQQALRDRKLYLGSIDGVMGAQTRAAIGAWQAACGMAVTGRITGEFLLSLKL